MSSDELLELSWARLDLRDKVLLAVMAPDSTASISAWIEVDKAAAEVVNKRRAYDKHIRQVVKHAGAKPSEPRDKATADEEHQPHRSPKERTNG